MCPLSMRTLRVRWRMVRACWLPLSPSLFLSLSLSLSLSLCPSVSLSLACQIATERRPRGVIEPSTQTPSLPLDEKPERAGNDSWVRTALQHRVKWGSAHADPVGERQTTKRRPPPTCAPVRAIAHAASGGCPPALRVGHFSLEPSSPGCAARQLVLLQRPFLAWARSPRGPDCFQPASGAAGPAGCCSPPAAPPPVSASERSPCAAHIRRLDFVRACRHRQTLSHQNLEIKARCRS
jgi:hypothetical protein